MTFPVTAKQSIVSEDDRHPVYSMFESESLPLPQWNFAKYIIDRDSTVLGVYPPDMPPTDPELLSALTKALEAE